MLVSSSLVNVADDAEIRLVNLLAESSGNGSFQQECEKSINAGDIDSLVSIVLKDAGATGSFLQMESEEEAVGAFSILVALLERLDNPQLSNQLCSVIVQGCSAATPEVCQRGVVLLSIIYNMKADPVQKCSILNSMYQIAAVSPALLAPDRALGSLLEDDAPATPLSPSVPAIANILDTWKIDASLKRQLYQTIISVLPSDKRQQRFLLLLLEVTETVDDVALEAARKAAIGAIQDPMTLFFHQRNMLKQEAIKGLAKKDPTLLELLKVFQEGLLSDYHAFLQSNGGTEKVLGSYGLNIEQCERNMKILSLCSLAAEHEEIPYQLISDTLQVGQDEVESWVIAAVGSGLLKAKMDQLSGKVLVEQCAMRRFDITQWKALQAKLVSYKKNIGDILATLKK